MPVTIEDVARSAGVSTKTVSRVLNGEDSVKEATRRKVLATIEALGYHPNPAAQHLAGGRSNLISLLIHDAASFYGIEILNGLLEVGAARGYRVSIQRGDLDQPNAVEQIIRAAAQRQFDGLILTPPAERAPRLLEALQAQRFPFVQLAPRERLPDRAWVAATDEQGAYDVTRHLLDLGHRRIGLIRGSLDYQASHDRLNGFVRAFAAYHLPPPADLILQGSWRFEAGQTCGMRLLMLPARPTAIVAANDEVAAGVLQAAWRLGLSCPAELSVTGFDDVPLAEQLCPPLTTARQPMREIAKTAMLMLLDALTTGQMTTRGVELATTLVIRSSTGAPPGAD